MLEEVSDPGQSGASLGPGIDRVRDLVAAGGVSVVLAQDRDRFAREPAYLYLLCARSSPDITAPLRALSDGWGDDSPEGELTDGGSVRPDSALREGQDGESLGRGKLRKAREGKVIAGSSPDYGFLYNERPRQLRYRRGNDPRRAPHLRDDRRGGTKLVGGQEDLGTRAGTHA